MNEPIVVTQTVKAPVAKVWQALTDVAEMKTWYFDMKGFAPEVGQQFEFEGGTDTNKYIHLCTVQEVVPFKKLSHTLRYKGYEGNTLVTYELEERGGLTHVQLTHGGVESFGTTNPDFARSNFEEGWNHIIKQALKEHVEKNEWS